MHASAMQLHTVTGTIIVIMRMSDAQSCMHWWNLAAEPFADRATRKLICDDNLKLFQLIFFTAWKSFWYNYLIRHASILITDSYTSHYYILTFVMRYTKLMLGWICIWVWRSLPILLKSGRRQTRLQWTNILHSGYLSGSRTLLFLISMHPVLPVYAREEFQFHVSNRFAPAFIRLGYTVRGFVPVFIRLGWLGDSV